jgi:hypothetical protein
MVERAKVILHAHHGKSNLEIAGQVECWFSILGQQALKGVSFASPTQLREAIDRFVKAYNKNAAPFEWTKVKWIRGSGSHAKAGLSRPYSAGTNSVSAAGTISIRAGSHPASSPSICT